MRLLERPARLYLAPARHEQRIDVARSGIAYNKIVSDRTECSASLHQSWRTR